MVSARPTRIKTEAIERFIDRSRRRWSGQALVLSLSLLAVLAALSYRLSADPHDVVSDIELTAAPDGSVLAGAEDREQIQNGGAARAAAGDNTGSDGSAPAGRLDALASAGRFGDAIAVDVSGGAADAGTSIGEGTGQTGPTIRSSQTTAGRSSGALFGGDVSPPADPDTIPGGGSEPTLTIQAAETTPSTITTTSKPSSTTTTARPSTTTTSRPSTTTTARPSTTTTSTTMAPEPPPSEPPVSQADGPIARNDQISGDAGKDLKVKVLENDSEGSESIDKDTLTIISGPAHAEEFRVHGDHIHYKSVDDFSGVDQLSYRICDDGGSCDQATVVIDVSD